MKDKLPDMAQDEQLELLAADGMLVKRPILIGKILCSPASGRPSGKRRSNTARNRCGLGLAELSQNIEKRTCEWSLKGPFKVRFWYDYVAQPIKRSAKPFYSPSFIALSCTRISRRTLRPIGMASRKVAISATGWLHSIPRRPKTGVRISRAGSMKRP